MTAAIQQLIDDLDAARADGTIYTYGQIQERLRGLIENRGAGVTFDTDDIGPMTDLDGNVVERDTLGGVLTHGISVGEVWRSRRSGQRVCVRWMDPPFELRYEILPPHNTVRDFGTMFASTLRRDYEKEQV